MNTQLRSLMVSCCLIVFLLSGCAHHRTQLWNGEDFTGWKLFVGDENVDVEDVWSIEDGVIKCKGVPNGYMRTESEYSNYVLTLEWRWAEKAFNSGVLLHTQAPDQIWPDSIECQLLAENAGDLILVNTRSITIDGKEYDNKEEAILEITKMQKSNEKPVGEWNQLKIICKDDSIACYVNGLLQNLGTEASLSKGKISLQSERGPVEFRNIFIKSL